MKTNTKNVSPSLKDRHFRQPRQRSRPLSSRRGAVLIAVLVCLGVSITLLTVMASRMMLTHRQLRRQAVNNQAQLLCQAGMERARKHAQDGSHKGSYNGETWRIPSSELGDQGAAEVTITLTKQPDADGQSTAIITARFPLNNQMETAYRRTITLNN